MTREKAIETVKEFINGTCLHLVDQEALETLIPELKESEDERIRKEIINFLRPSFTKENLTDEKVSSWIDYLEKLKEQKPAECAPDSALQKIKRAITDCKSLSEHYKDAKENFYQYYGGKAEGLQLALTYFTNENEQPLEEQKPAECLKAERDGWYVCIKDYYRGGKKQSSVGDLVQAKGGMFMMGEEDISEWFRRAYYEEVRDAFEPNADTNIPEQKPAEWKLPDDFEEAVYKVANFISPFNSQEELRKVSHRFAEQLLDMAKKDEPKQEWSEEDKRKLNRIYELLGCAADDKGFLTSKRIIGDKEAIELQDFLKSLRPSWKSSEEQMKHLERCFTHGHTVGLPNQHVLESLYNDLKKL